MKTFLLKVKHFFKRNIYPITVTLCTALVLGIIAVSAYSSIKSSNNEVMVNTNVPEDTGGNVNSGDDDGENDKSDENGENDEPASSGQVIIFNLPFENATISKEYSEDTLLYDATSKYWQTHQGLDFSCAEGQEIVAVYSGTIEKIESSMMYGTVIYLKVSDELTVVYKGLSGTVKVAEGDSIQAGQVIGTATTSLFEQADGVHIHLELYKNGTLIDPTDYFSFDK